MAKPLCEEENSNYYSAYKYFMSKKLPHSYNLGVESKFICFQFLLVQQYSKKG